MNGAGSEPPIGFWKRLWYEPRRFFFWVALVSPVVYLLNLLITSEVDALLSFTRWVALAAIVGFLVSVPAFFLVWIPPVRRGFARLLQHKVLVLATLATLVALFYAVENWRGRSAWNQFRGECEARGVEFDIDKIMPPPVPAADNMYEAEPWRGFHFTKAQDGTIRFERPGIQGEVWFDVDGPNYRDAPDGTDLFRARRVDLAAWQAFYRGTNNQFAAGATPTNYWPVAPSPQTAAQDVLQALSRFEDQYRQIQSAALRPRARFWLNLEDGFGTLLPHLAKNKSIASYLRLRSTALLAAGQADAAFRDVRLALRVGDAVGDEPILISHLVRIAVLYVNLGAVWEGLAAQRWTDAQLAALEGQLASTDLLAEYHRSMAGELYFATWYVDQLRRTGDLELLRGSGEPRAPSLGIQIMAQNNRLLSRLVPQGWYDQNKLSLGRRQTEYILPLVDVKKRLVPRAQSQRAADLVASLRPTPYDLFSPSLIPALTGAAAKTATAQTYVDLARVACALERYRLANGDYPASLEMLSPKYLTQLPHDVINGEPLKYRRTANSFLLYSVGWNETDDGGKVGLTEGRSHRFDADKGDWVWTYSPAAE